MVVVSISSITNLVKNVKVEDGIKSMVAAVQAAVLLDYFTIIHEFNTKKITLSDKYRLNLFLNL
jgi:hypothetical protein